MPSQDLAFEEVDHTADLALRAWGQDLAQLFVHAAQGMFSLMRCTPGNDARPISHRIILDAYDLEALLVDWLNELVYLSESALEFYDTYEIVQIAPTHLKAVVRGMTHHPPEKGIKAATFSDLSVGHDAQGYHVLVTFDV
jgi:SHS2 domain-containing protein